MHDDDKKSPQFAAASPFRRLADVVSDLSKKSRRSTDRVRPFVTAYINAPSWARVTVAASMVAALGVAAVTETRDGTTEAASPIAGNKAAVERSITERAQQAEAATRSQRTAPKPPQAAPAPATKAAPAPAKAAPAPAPKEPTQVAPVAGLSQVQMNNAHAIVKAGLRRGVPQRGLVIAVATAMQESTLLNRASEVLPESKRYAHQGTGSDHDSVGLFQQRPSSGWGPVAKLMQPDYAAGKFYAGLMQVPGWNRMSLTLAAQAVQVSAYPYAYAKHEQRAAAIVNALLKAGVTGK
ncbi:hypothetical protein [Phytohabitans aurantiacus]|jgi:hypothetical protein|uniref:Peptidase M23 n=1 Tax=Phytohabitans aurantiacus TaxID=3016789 RepID=A0ABQ5QUH4_9ACTN|nr:hypothetical protein [Phytohabitans aurantiacus]GLH97527.1 hypothetical protein Pa4123_28020 [Phytohabitans aurantiacus]